MRTACVYRYPGTDDGSMEDDVARLREITRGVLADCGAANCPYQEDLVAEFWYVYIESTCTSCTYALIIGLSTPTLYTPSRHSFDAS